MTNMHVKTVIRYFCYSLAAALVLLSFWCLFWILSSFSMAFTNAPTRMNCLRRILDADSRQLLGCLPSPAYWVPSLQFL